MGTSPTINVAAVQMVSSVGVQHNINTASRLIDQAVQRGAQIVLLPEYFCIMGKSDTDKLKFKEPFGSGILQNFLSEQAKAHKIWLVGGTIPLENSNSNRIYNTCLVYSPDGAVVARYDKIHLFGFNNGSEVYSEAATIMPGTNQPQVFESPFGSIGLSVCYDLRFPELYRAMQGVNMVVVPSAFTYTTGRAHWEVLLRARAIENQCYILAAAQGGKHESGRRTWGHSMLIDPWGKVLDVLPEGEGVVYGTISTNTLNRVRTALPALTHKVLL